jgi:hypothetical protein
MGIAYRADRPLGCTISVWDGSISPADVQEHLIAIAGDRDWPPGPLHLTDLTTIVEATIPDAQLVDLLYEGTNLAEELKVAVVVRADFPSTRDLRFASAAREMRATTFADFTSACAYLGVDAASVQATVEDLRTELTRRHP